MKKVNFIHNILQGTKILRPPKHTLATFGSTTLHYVLLSEIPQKEDHCRRRIGQVTAERPKILTPDLWGKRFEGFGEETEAYRKLIDQWFGDAARGLEYLFKNNLESTSTEAGSLVETVDRTLQAMERENAPRTALLQGPDSAWGLSVMKFIVEISLRSFPTNWRELDERGLFDPANRAAVQQKRLIEQLFIEARTSPAAMKKLAETLKNTGAFEDYEDRFFALVNNS